MDDLTSSYASRVRASLPRRRVRGLPTRPPRHRLVGGDRRRRVPAAGAGRPQRGDRLAGGSGVVERPGRHVRHVVFGVQLDPAGHGTATRAGRDLRDLRDGRPVHRRRPLHGWRAARDRPGRLLPLHVGASSRSPRAVGVRRRAGATSGVGGSRATSRGSSAGSTSRSTARTGGTARCVRTYERIECPTMLVVGWADGYRNNTFRTFEGLRCPKRLLAGPWSHMSTATSLPGPHIDLVPELCRWFGHWLRDDDNGVDVEPPIQLFMRRSTRPEPDLAEHRGEWRAEPIWPPARLRPRTLRAAPAAGADEVAIRGETGTTAWISCAARLPWGQPLDQRPDDALSRDLRLGAPRRGARDRGSPVVENQSHFLGAGRLPLRKALRRLPRRDVGADHAWGAQPRAARVDDRAVAAPGRRACHDRARRSRRRPGSSSPVTRSASSLAGVGLAEPAGRLRRAGTLTARSRVLGARAPGSRRPTGRARPRLHAVSGQGSPRTTRRRDAPQPEVVWRVEHDVLGREVRAVIAHGSDYDGDCDSRCSERYEGVVAVSTDDPGEAWATAVRRATGSAGPRPTS